MPSLEPPTPGSPSDNTTLSQVIGRLDEAGFTAQFTPQEDACVECSSCLRHVKASLLNVETTRRMEGASDPDDMLTVVSANCPECHAGGTMVLGFGPTASALDAAVQRDLPEPANGTLADVATSD
jgi:hypothetical protein